MKNLFFLALALASLGLSSCQKEDAAPCSNCIEIKHVKLINDNPRGSYSSSTSRFWRDEQGRNSQPDIYVELRQFVNYNTSSLRRISAPVLSNRLPSYSTKIPIKSTYFDNNSPYNISIFLMDEDIREGGSTNRMMAATNLSPADLLSSREEEVTISLSYDISIQLSLKYH